MGKEGGVSIHDVHKRRRKVKSCIYEVGTQYDGVACCVDMTYGMTRGARCNLKCGQHSISPLLLLFSFIVQRKKRNVAVVEKSAHLNFK